MNGSLVAPSVLGRRVGVEVDLLLGLASIPFTLVLTTDPTSIRIAPVLVAGIASGLYYGMRSKSVRRAGFRTGLVGGAPVIVPFVELVHSVLSLTDDRLAFAIVAGALGVCFLLAVTAFLAELCAVVGGWVAREFVGTTQRGA